MCRYGCKLQERLQLLTGSTTTSSGHSYLSVVIEDPPEQVVGRQEYAVLLALMRDLLYVSSRRPEIRYGGKIIHNFSASIYEKQVVELSQQMAVYKKTPTNKAISTQISPEHLPHSLTHFPYLKYIHTP